MRKKRILVVEDEIIIAMEIADTLKAKGYDVLRIVSNGEMAIKSAASENPDLILMDIMIQGDIDGIETAMEIHQKSDIPVIYLTANADDATLERAKISDAFGYLIKPFEEKELNTTIEMALYKHNMEKKLRESEARFKSLVENSSIGIFRFSHNGEIVHANPTFLKLVGLENEYNIIGDLIDDYLVGGSNRREEIISIIKENQIINGYKVHLLNKRGNKVVVSLGGNLVNDTNYIDGTVEDITIQHKYEKELIIAKEKAEESDRLKTEFLAGMSHEIRTPINTIMSYLSLLKHELNEESGSPYNEIFDAIQVGSLRLTRTIDSILNMAQFQSGTFEVFKTELNIVDEILEGIYNEFKYTSKHRSLDFKFINKSPNQIICGDKYSLSQLFVNLIDNALKYTKEGFVKLIVYNNIDDNLCVDVEDSGIGISEEFLPTLFDAFTQEEQGYKRKFDGNGLGLALVKRYCDLNNASIKVISNKDSGTKFTVKFENSNNQNSITDKIYNHMSAVINN